MAYRLHADETLRDGLCRAAAEQLDTAIDALSGEGSADRTDAIHDARKAIKKRRSLLRLTRRSLPGEARRRENEILRTAARAVSDVRDAEVMLETMDAVAQRYAGQLPESAFAAARRPLTEALAAERVRTDGPAAAPRALDALRTVADRDAPRRMREVGWSELERGMRRTHRRGAAAYKRARRDGSPQAMHAWRKRVKDLWYELRLLSELGGPAVAGHAKDAHALADVLGDDHDLGVLRAALVRAHGRIAGDLDAILRLIDVRRSELREQALALAPRLYGEPPRAFARRIRDACQAGRRVAAASTPAHPREVARATHAAVV